LHWKFSSKQFGFLALSLVLLFLLFLNVQSSGLLIAHGSNFNIYFVTNSKITFQHLDIPHWAEAFNASVTVTSGTLNGTNCKLEMRYSEGELSFLSKDSAVLTPTNALIILKDSSSTEATSIENGDAVIIRWSGGFAWNPIGLIMGLIGLLLFIVSPTYTVFEVKKKKNYMAIFYCFILMAIGYGFLVAWLG